MFASERALTIRVGTSSCLFYGVIHEVLMSRFAPAAAQRQTLTLYDGALL